MAQAVFTGLFLGIETPDPAALKECNKRQNLNRDLVETIRTIQAHGNSQYLAVALNHRQFF